ncbi:MAG: hypothetical protein IJ398_08115 [Clostridia bacterium]|nr:hypothetical protein [Clostridia bacterium]
MKIISAECCALLKKYGFDDSSNRDLSFGFPAPAYVMDTKMLVQGDHTTDHAYIYYACVDTYEGERLDGFFYSPSLLEYLLIDFGGEWDFNRMLKAIQRQLDCEVRLVSVNGYPNLFIELDEQDGKTADIRFQISDMLKLIGQLDYLLSRKLESLRAKRRRA